MIKEKLKTSRWGMLPVILALAWPTMVEQVMHAAVQYIDTAMVGSLGTQATASVGSTTTVNWLLNGSISALGVGFLAFIAKAYGAGDKKLASRAASQAVLAVLVVGSSFTALTLSLSSKVPVWMQVDESIRETASQYFFILYTPMLFRAATLIFGTSLRAVGDTKTPMRVGVAVNLTNVILNFLFIYPTRPLTVFSFTFTMPGMGWGVIGAAIASAIAFAVGGIFMTIVFWRHPALSPKGQKLRPDMEVLKPCLKVALPNMLQRFGTSLGYVAFASMINSLGEISTAAHTIANTVESGFYIPANGMREASATLAGNAFGAKDKKRMQALAKTAITLEVCLMVVTGTLLFISAPTMMRIFSKSEEVIALGSTVLRMVAVSEPFYGATIVMEGMMHGTGNTITPFMFNISGMWCVRILGTFICTQLLGLALPSAWGCMIGHNLLLFTLYSIHYLRGRWNPLNRVESTAK